MIKNKPKIRVIQEIINRNPNEVFVITYRNKDLHNYGGESINVFGYQVIPEIKRLVKTNNKINDVFMSVCSSAGIETLIKEEGYDD